MKISEVKLPLWQLRGISAAFCVVCTLTAIFHSPQAIAACPNPPLLSGNVVSIPSDCTVSQDDNLYLVTSEIDTLENKGSLSSLTGRALTITFPAGSIRSLTNSGTISGDRTTIFIASGTIETFINESTGQILGNKTGPIFSNRLIVSLTNKGVIALGSDPDFPYAITGSVNSIVTLTNETSGKIIGGVGSSNELWGVGTLVNKGLIDGPVSLKSDTTLNIEGDSSRITGIVDVAKGTVNVNGEFTTENTFDVNVFNIATGGTLTLAHKITTGPSSFHNDGTLIVAAGTQNIVGKFTTSGTFSPIIVDTDNYGKLFVDGDVELGGTLKANNGEVVTSLKASGLPDVISLTDIISYTGSRTGEFDEVLGANNLFEWDAEYDDQNKRVNLVLVAAQAPDDPDEGGGGSGGGGSGGGGSATSTSVFYQTVSAAGATPAYQAAHVLDTIASTNVTNPVVLSFLNVPQAQVADAVVQTLPLLTGNSQLAAMTALNDIDEAVKARLDFNRGELTDGAMFTDRKVWMRPFGSWVDQKNRGDYYGYSGSTGGLVIGADANVATGLQMGLAFGYAQANIKGNTPIKSNSYDLDTYQVLGYGRYELGQGTELEFQAGVGMNKNKGTRLISYAGSTAKSSYESTTASAGLGLRHQLKINSSTTFTPEVRADYGWISDDGYTETGAQSLNLIVKGRDHDQLMLSAGGYASYEVQKGLALRAGLALGYDALNSQARITSAYSGAPQTTFVTDGIDPSPWQFMGSLALVGELANGMQVSATYGASYRQDFLNQNVSLNLRIGF